MKDQKSMTCGELKQFLSTLTEDQLAQEVKVSGEKDCWWISGTDILTEDHINPSGEGMEPLSDYADDDECDKTIVATAGTVFLLQAF